MMRKDWGGMLTMLSRSVLMVVAVAMLGLGVTPVAAGAPAGAAHHAAVGRFGPLIDLAVQRIMLGDKVAAAKFGTTQPIDDPVREQQVLDTVARMSAELGLDPAVSVRLFRDQIEANKVVQRGLFALWTAHPELAPTERPDLVTEVRPQLDRITRELLRELVATVDIRRPAPRCHAHLTAGRVSANVSHRLDSLHRKALGVALRSVCG
jgi:chorismate mutase